MMYIHIPTNICTSAPYRVNIGGSRVHRTTLGMDGTEDARASSVLPSVIHTCTFFPDGTRTVLRCIAKAALLSLFRSQCFNAWSPFFLSECTAWLVGDRRQWWSSGARWARPPWGRRRHFARGRGRRKTRIGSKGTRRMGKITRGFMTR